MLKNKKYIPLFNYHGCSICRFNEEYEIQLPYESYELFSKNILEFKYVFNKLEFIYDVIFDYNAASYKVTYDKYFNISHFIKYILLRKYANVVPHEQQYKLTFNVQGIKYIRLMTVLISLLDTYTLIKKMPLDPRMYEAFKVPLSRYEILKYTDNLDIFTNMEQYLKNVNYRCQKIDEENYIITCPYYKSKIYKEDVISDIIFSYYLTPWKN